MRQKPVIHIILITLIPLFFVTGIVLIILLGAGVPFAERQWLITGLPLLGGGALSIVIINYIWRRRTLRIFAEESALERIIEGYNPARQLLKGTLIIAVIIFAVIALARPQWGLREQEVTRRALNIIIAVDTSQSMMAEDHSPNRLEKARKELNAFVQNMKGDRLGLIVFAGKAYLLCPLTMDYGAVREYINAIDVNTISLQGTAIADAIDTAITVFNNRQSRFRILIVLTDGEDHEGNMQQSIKNAKKEGVVVYTVGIGSPGGAPIPIIGSDGNMQGYKKDNDGNVIMTKLNEDILRRVALETGGKYYSATSGELELKKIFDEIINLERETISTTMYATREERFQYFLACAIMLLILDLILPERIRRKKKE